MYHRPSRRLFRQRPAGKFDLLLKLQNANAGRIHASRRDGRRYIIFFRQK